MSHVALDRFRPSSPGPTGLFLDTSGLFARFHPDAPEHEPVRALFSSIASGELPYRPLVTNTYILDELATLLTTAGRHEYAATALQTLDASDAITVQTEDETVFERARETFLAYEDQEISFTDHYCAATMDEAAISHVLSFDGDYATFGHTVLPRGEV